MKKQKTCSFKDLRAIMQKKTPLTAREKRFVVQAQKAWQGFSEVLESFRDFVADEKKEAK